MRRPLSTVVRLSAGAGWIRTSSSAPDRQRFRGFVQVQVGLIHRRRDGLIRPVAGLASNRSSCRAAVREAPLTARISLRGTESLLTHRWRGLDSNFQYAVA